MGNERETRIDALGDRRQTKSSKRSQRAGVVGGGGYVAGQSPSRFGRKEANAIPNHRDFEKNEATIIAIRQTLRLMMNGRIVRTGAICTNRRIGPISRAGVRWKTTAISTKRSQLSPRPPRFRGKRSHRGRAVPRNPQNEATTIGAAARMRLVRALTDDPNWGRRIDGGKETGDGGCGESRERREEAIVAGFASDRGEAPDPHPTPSRQRRSALRSAITILPARATLGHPSTTLSGPDFPLTSETLTRANGCTRFSTGLWSPYSRNEVGQRPACRPHEPVRLAPTLCGSGCDSLIPRPAMAAQHPQIQASAIDRAIRRLASASNGVPSFQHTPSPG